MTKYRIELSEEQLILIAQCLEDISRFASGQWELKNTIEQMVKGLEFEVQIDLRNMAELRFREAKRILLPSLPDNGSKGYKGTDFIGNTYQIYRSIYHRLAIDNDWNNVYSSPALKSGNMGKVIIEKIKENEDSKL